VGGWRRRGRGRGANRRGAGTRAAAACGGTGVGGDRPTSVQHVIRCGFVRHLADALRDTGKVGVRGEARP